MEISPDGMSIRKIVESSHNQMPLHVAFPEITAEDMKALKPWYWHKTLNDDPSKASMQMYWHSYLLRLNGKLFLIDTCAGNHKTRAHPIFDDLDTPFLLNLAAAGVTPEEIDYVLCTHLHFDHVGWNTKLEDGRWVPTFPNAKYVFTRKDYDYYTKVYNNPNDPCQLAAAADSLIPIVEHGLAELVETDHVIEHELAAGVWLEGIPGHSPGNCVIHAGPRGRSSAIFTGDVFHTPLQIIRPSLRFSGDDDPELAPISRAAFFERCADTDSILLPAHFFAGRIVRFQDSLRYRLLNGEQRPLDYYRYI
jgi:glyoxylase-like metal-dependent hydrolase (beta-lactamase superfamily II)